MADGGGHAADLAVFALVQGEGEPFVGHVFAEAHGRIARRERGDLAGGHPTHAHGSAGVVGEFHAGGEAGEGFVGGHAFDEGPVFAFVGVARIEEAGVEAGLVGEKEEAFAVGVETAERIDARRQARRAEIGEGFPRGTGLGGELRENAVRFVEGEKHDWQSQ